MQIGVVFPQTEFGHDPAALREYARTADGLGYSHVLAYDHVLGANADRPGPRVGPYSHTHPFLEPFVLFSFMASITTRLHFCSGVIILPQRQTALVAKQAATLDALSGGRLRLGVGLGWNETEYVALNEDFHNRGRRMEEQIDVLRRLWTEPLVNYSGRWHTSPDAGLNPMPVQRPIPLWFGAGADAALKRAARLGDGWMPNSRTADDAAPHLARLDQYLAEAGRSRADFGIEARLPYGDGDPEVWTQQRHAWQAAGATHMAVNMMGAGLAGPADHLQALRHFALAMGLPGA